MDAAVDMEEDCVFLPEPEEEEEHRGFCPESDEGEPEPAPEEEPREPIARLDFEEPREPIAQQEEPTHVELPVLPNDAGPEADKKRRRLLTKTTVEGVWPVRVSPSPAAPPKPSPAAPPSAAGPRWWTDLSFEKKAGQIEAMVREQGWKRYQATLSREERLKLPMYWSKLNLADKRVVVNWWYSGEGANETPSYMRDWVFEVYMTQYRPPKADGCRRYQGKQFLFTCNGDWGLVEVPKDVSLSPVESEAIEQLRNLDSVKSVWLKVREEAAALTTRVGAEDFAVCLELCSKTYKDEGVVRLHAHVALASTKRLRWVVKSLAEQVFLNGSYRLQTDEVVGKQRKIGWQTFYYTSCPKKSQLWSYATKQPFDDYLVNANWIWNHVQAGKISVEAAKAEFIRCGNRLTQHLPNLDRLRSELIALQLAETIAAKEAAFAAERRPFKKIKPVQKLVEDLDVPRERRKFLVLDGPSRLGKTQYAMSLFGREASLEVNAADEPQPSLQHFDFKRHRLVLLDEASPEMVLRNRKVFQAPNAVLELGQSKTNCHSYQCYLNSALLCIASNGWQAAVDALPPASRKWIEANQVLVSVTRPLWVQTPAQS